MTRQVNLTDEPSPISLDSVLQSHGAILAHNETYHAGYPINDDNSLIFLTNKRCIVAHTPEVNRVSYLSIPYRKINSIEVSPPSKYQYDGRHTLTLQIAGQRHPIQKRADWQSTIRPIVNIIAAYFR